MQTFRGQSTDWKCSIVLGKFATTESAVSPNDHITQGKYILFL
jgi:hypothetical protein